MSARNLDADAECTGHHLPLPFYIPPNSQAAARMTCTIIRQFDLHPKPPHEFRTFCWFFIRISVSLVRALYFTIRQYLSYIPLSPILHLNHNNTCLFQLSVTSFAPFFQLSRPIIALKSSFPHYFRPLILRDDAAFNLAIHTSTRFHHTMIFRKRDLAFVVGDQVPRILFLLPDCHLHMHPPSPFFSSSPVFSLNLTMQAYFTPPF